MSVTISWTATALGAAFDHGVVSRLHPSGDGYQPIAWYLPEATASFIDFEARRGTAESYLVQVVDTDGITSVPLTAVTATSAAGPGWVITSNIDPTITRTLQVGRPNATELPENATVTAATGRDGQQVHRGLERLGDPMDWLLHLNAPSALGPALWEQLVETMRRPDLPYIAVLDPYGNRRHAALLPASTSMNISTDAQMSARMIPGGDTPAIVTVT